MDKAIDIYNDNDFRLMTNFAERLIRVGGSILDKVLLRQGIVQIRLALEDRTKRVILNF